MSKAEGYKRVDIFEGMGKRVSGMSQDNVFLDYSKKWLERAIAHKYAYNFTWLGRPVLQLPQDIYAVQEIVWHVQPDLIIETGIAHGGSLVLSASMLALLDYCEAASSDQPIVARESRRRVLGIDIDIRKHNAEAIEKHPLSHLIMTMEGSSTDRHVVEKVTEFSKDFARVMVLLDSNHTHAHVLAELEAYAPLVTPESYCVVWDTGLEDLPGDSIIDRPWGAGNNPKTAVRSFLYALEKGKHIGMDGRPLAFERDKSIEGKLGITASPEGFLRRVSL